MQSEIDVAGGWAVPEVLLSGHVGSSHAGALVNVLGHFRAECDVADPKRIVEKIKLLGYTFGSLSELDRDAG